MTREEAIAILKKGTMFEPTLENKDYIEAFEMAIKALSQEPQWNEPEDPPEDDRLILLSFANYPVPAIGRYIGSEEEGGAFYIDSAKESLSSIGLVVNGWQESPKCKEE